MKRVDAWICAGLRQPFWSVLELMDGSGFGFLNGWG
jgi:hypothetical protein